MKKIRILTIITNNFSVREGVSTVVLDYFRRFDRDRFQLELIAYDTSSPLVIRDFQDAGITVRMLPSRKGSMFRYILGLMRLLSHEKYDAVYVHGSSAIMSIELGLAKLYGCKVRVPHSHSTSCSHKKADRLLRPFFYRLYTDALACGTDAGKWLYGNRPFRVFRNGRSIDMYRFDQEKRTAMRMQLGLADNVLAVGHVGGFTENKNQSFILRAFQELRSRRPDARLFLMGSGATLDRVKALAEELGIGEYVTFTGSISNVNDMLQAMDVMVMPSRFEGMPLVVGEWQIAGLPCLLSDTITRECAYSELVEYMSLSRSPGDWAEKLLEMADRTEREKIAGEMVKLTAEKGFDITHNVRELEAFFTDKCGE